MSGKLVDEVLAAREDVLRDLSERETLALIAIANRCFNDTRIGSVPYSYIESVTGCSRRTAERIVSKLVSLGIIQKIQRGIKSHGVVRAPVYLLPPLRVAETQGFAPATQMAEARDCASAKSECASAKTGFASATHPPLTWDVGTPNGTTNGITNVEKNRLTPFDDIANLFEASTLEPPGGGTEDFIDAEVVPEGCPHHIWGDEPGCLSCEAWVLALKHRGQR